MDDTIVPKNETPDSENETRVSEMKMGGGESMKLLSA